MKQLVECVPNFSEGRDRAIIDQICAAIAATPGVSLLDVDPGADTNRTVVTFVGEPEAVLEGAYRGIAQAAELIDMRRHRGAHARLGATDVCPFVPVSGITMEACAALARRLGKRVGEELQIPVYLYEAAASRPERKNLAHIRAGEYEGFFQKIQEPEWAPDFGPRQFNAKSGGAVIGARPFLIAYNINLNTRDKGLAQEIALALREQGRAQRDAKGEIVRDERGEKVMVPGKFKEVKAVGWYIEQYQCAQISINLTNYHISPPHLVFEEACRQAEALGLRVTGSEVVGLIPKEALLLAGRYFLRRQRRSAGVPERELLRLATQSLGLSELAPFKVEEKVIELRVQGEEAKLAGLKVGDYLDELSSDSPAPGGGSASALAGAQAAGLAAMVANLTVGKKGYEAVWEEMNQVAEAGQQLKDRLRSLIDEDTAAFNEVMAAMRLPKATPEDQAKRKAAMEEATKKATLIPLEVMRQSEKTLPLIEAVAAKGNKNSLSDAGVAASQAKACARGAYLNVLINLQGISDRAFAATTAREAKGLLARVEQQAGAVEQRLAADLEGKAAGK